MQKRNKLIIGVGVGLIMAYFLWPTRVECGRKGYTCVTAPTRTDDGTSEVCSFYSVAPKFSAIFDLGIDYTGQIPQCTKS